MSKNDQNNGFAGSDPNFTVGNQDFSGGDPNFTVGNQDFSGSDPNFAVGNQDFSGSDPNFAIGNQDFFGGDQNFAVDDAGAAPAGGQPGVVPNMFADNDSIKTVNFVEADEPAPKAEPTKKKSKAPMIIIPIVLVLVLAAATVFLVPFICLKMGDSKVADGDYGAAADMYGLTFGMYDSQNRVNATAAIIVAESGEAETGIAMALENGINVEITYDLNGGRFINDSRQEKVLFDDAEDFKTLYQATKDNYSFAGWNVSDISYVPDFNDLHISLSLKANFELTKYEISYTNLFDDANEENPIEYTYESSTFTLTNPSRVGYTFDGWSGTDIGGVSKTVVVSQGSSGNRSYIANWTPDTYTVTFNPDVECTIENPMTVTYDDAFTMPMVEKRGYTYRGWSDGTNTFTNGLWTLTKDVSVAPVWELNTYTLTYDLGGGQVATPNAASYTVLDDAIKITNPTRFGYTFLGWTYEGQNSAKKDVVIAAHSVGNYNFVANWIGNPHKITLDLGGGTAPSNVINVRYGSEYSVPTPTKTGYTFLGWYSGNTKQATSGIWNKDGDHSMTAKWSANQYKLTFDSAGGTSCSPMTVTYDNYVTLPTTTRRGYTFKGWYQWSTVYSSGAWKTANDVKLTAVWKANTYTISLNTSGGKVSPSGVTATFDQSYTLPTPTRTGYSFMGWYNGSTKYTGGTWTQDNGITLTAKWDANDYTVTLDAEGGSVSKTKYTFTYDSSYSLPTPTREGYDFVGWYDGKTKISNSGTYKWAENLKLSANWEGKEYTVYFDANGGKVSATKRTVVYDEVYKLPTPTRTGYDFVGWYYGSTKISTTGTWKRTSDITVEARWELIECDVELDANGGNVSRKSYEFTYGQSYTLPTPSREGYNFLGWYDGSKKVALSGVWEYEDDEMELVAKWEKIEVTTVTDYSVSF